MQMCTQKIYVGMRENRDEGSKIRIWSRFWTKGRTIFRSRRRSGSKRVRVGCGRI